MVNQTAIPIEYRGRSWRFRALATVAAAAVLYPLPALACPMCFSAKNEAGRVAYLATTGVLTFLPLIVIGTTIFLVKRHIEKNSVR